jgi:hypothetical protein
MGCLRARVQKSEEDAGGNDCQRPHWVEIEKLKDEGYVLVHVYEVKYCRHIHTWHSSITSAMAEANADFSVAEKEWTLVGRKES